MTSVQVLLNQKMALERMIEQARIEELETQRRIEAERLAIKKAEIAEVQANLQTLMKKYGLTESQLLRGEEPALDKSSSEPKNSFSKNLTLQEMRNFYAKM